VGLGGNVFCVGEMGAEGHGGSGNDRRQKKQIPSLRYGMTNKRGMDDLAVGEADSFAALRNDKKEGHG
jgi:hypothetical protein